MHGHWLIRKLRQAGRQIFGEYFPLGIINVFYWQRDEGGGVLARAGGAGGHLTLACNDPSLSTHAVTPWESHSILLGSLSKDWIQVTEEVKMPDFSCLQLPATATVCKAGCPWLSFSFQSSLQSLALSFFLAETHQSMQAFVLLSTLSPLTLFWKLLSDYFLLSAASLVEWHGKGRKSFDDIILIKLGPI